jgi:tRNA A-37 threonylcarbamoyl transferase component Bud32
MSAKDYVPFSIANQLYYDSPDQLKDVDSYFAATNQKAPSGWTRQLHGLSVSLRSDAQMLPDQGWKIHVSATPTNAENIVDLVWNYCIKNQIAFKFLRSRSAVMLASSKYWSRSASGKFITLYPDSDDKFGTILLDLEPELREYAGPYILSDLRYCDGPLYVRYGAFRAIWQQQEDGIRVASIITPDKSLVEDRRDPVFTVPDFVKVPEIIRPFLTKTLGSLEEFIYDFDHALHFSNGGGIYLARDSSTGEQVVIREARPHAGLDSNGDDAVNRLLREKDVLSMLGGLDCVPRLINHKKVWEHHFLVTEFIDGLTLLEEIIQRYPLVHPAPTETELLEYIAWAKSIFRKLKKAIKKIHLRKVKIVDIHPSNIIVRSNGSIAIIDFECSDKLSNKSRLPLGALGFSSKANLSPEESDKYAYNCVRLMVLMPLVPLLNLDITKAQTLVNAACANLPLKRAFGARLIREISRTKVDSLRSDVAANMFISEHFDWASARDSLVAGINAVATPERDDRLFPGDPLQFANGGATLGYGAAGVLLALSLVGEQVSTSFVEWLVSAGSRTGTCLGYGLYDGLHGVAYALESLGARAAALEVLNRASAGTSITSIGLFSGQAGIALNYLHFAQLVGDRINFSKAEHLCEALLSKLRDADGDALTVSAGLMHGATGAALLFLRFFELTGEDRFLDATEKAIRRDLSFGTTLPDGAFHLHVGTRYLVYLDGGSAGIGLVLAKYLSYRESPDLEAILQSIYQGCRIPFVMQPGLFQGRAGLIATLGQSLSDVDRAESYAQIARLGWHALMHQNSLAFPGTGLTRISYDLGTGSSGIMLALNSALKGCPIGLPFL